MSGDRTSWEVVASRLAEEGSSACLSGEDKDTCPYAGGEAQAWRRGFNQARSQLKDGTAKPRRPDIPCADCQGMLQLQALPDEWRRDERDGRRWVYLCENRPRGCRGLISAHPDGRPLGSPADAATRKARTITHARFDALWKTAPHLYPELDDRGLHIVRRAARNRAYAWLAQQLDIPVDACHIAMMDLPMLRRAYVALKPATAAMIRDWHKSGRPALPAASAARQLELVA